MSPSPSGPLTQRLRIAAVLVVVALLAVAHHEGVFRQLSDPKSAAQSLVDLGAWGYVAFVVAYALFQPFGVPGTVFIIAAPLLWPWPVAFALSMTGTMAASTLGFAFARFVARDWVSGRIPERFRKYDDALTRRAFATVFVLRLVFWMPPLLHAFFGVSKVRFWTHFLASFLGYLIPVFLVSFFGQRMMDMAMNAPPAVWIGLGAGLGTSLIVAWAGSRHLRSTMAPPEAEEGSSQESRPSP